MPARPAPPRRAGGRDAGIANRHEATVTQRDCPAGALRPGPSRPHVTTEIDRGIVEPLAETISEPAFADAAEVDCAAGRDPRPSVSDLEHVRQGRHFPALSLHDGRRI